MNKVKIITQVSSAFICLLILLSVDACRLPWPSRPAVLESGMSPSESKMYGQAVEAYQAMNYAKARELFTRIREQTTNQTTARMALYGLACSRLIMATTPKDYKEALALWETWVQCAPAKQDHENPVLLAPILDNKMIFSHMPSQMLNGELPDDGQDEVQWYMLNADSEMQRLKRQLKTSEQDIENKDKTIKNLEKEIARLEQQIKAFETIDQKIQKKKNAIPITD